MSISEPFERYLRMSAVGCLWCRGSGFPDHDGLNRCDQCFYTATLLETLEADLREELEDVTKVLDRQRFVDTMDDLSHYTNPGDIYGFVINSEGPGDGSPVIGACEGPGDGSPDIGHTSPENTCLETSEEV